MKKALVLGAGGFIGSHMVKNLKKRGYWVRGVDLKYPEFAKTEADDFIIGDLQEKNVCETNVCVVKKCLRRKKMFATYLTQSAGHSISANSMGSINLGVPSKKDE